jgi:hypothetical protein
VDSAGCLISEILGDSGEIRKRKLWRGTKKTTGIQPIEIEPSVD